MQVREVDTAEGRDALVRFAVQIEAAEPAVLRGLNSEVAALTALRVEDDIVSSGLRPAFEAFVTPHWSLQPLDDLRPLCLAVLAAYYDVLKADVGSSEAVVPMDVVGQAFDLRGTMLDTLRYNVGHLDAVAAEIKSIMEGAGHRDLANDLERCADLYAAHAAVLARDQVKYEAGHGDEARKLAGQIRGYLGNGETPSRIALRGRLARVVGLMLAAYDEVAAAGRFIERHRKGDARFAALRAQI